MIIRLGLEKIKAYLKENTKLEPYRFGLMNLFRLQSHLQNDEVNQKIKAKKNKINGDLTLYSNKIHDMKYGSIFVGETASHVNEILLNRYLPENATTIDEKNFYLSKEIENYYTTMDLIRKAYQKIIHEYYGESVVYDEESDIEWIRLGHLYRWSYYPYKYATGLIMASSIVDSLFSAKSLTTKDYLNFLSLGSSDDSLTLLKKINIDLLDKQVLQNGLNVMKDDVMLLQLLLKEKTQS